MVTMAGSGLDAPAAWPLGSGRVAAAVWTRSEYENAFGPSSTLLGSGEWDSFCLFAEWLPAVEEVVDDVGDGGAKSRSSCSSSDGKSAENSVGAGAGGGAMGI